MRLDEVIRKTHEHVPGSVLIRRACWLPEAKGLLVDSEIIWQLKDGRAIQYTLCVEEVLTNDWEIEEIAQ